MKLLWFVNNIRVFFLEHNKIIPIIPRMQGEFENVEKVEKFELSIDEYKNRTDTVAAYLK